MEMSAQQAAQQAEQNAAAESLSLKEVPRDELTWEEVEGVRKAVNALTTEDPEELTNPVHIYLRHAHGILVGRIYDKSFVIEALGGHGLRGDTRGIMQALEHETRSRGCTALEGLVRDPRLKRLYERKLGMKSLGVVYRLDLWGVKKKREAREAGKEPSLFEKTAGLIKRIAGSKDGKDKDARAARVARLAARLKFGRAGRAAREAEAAMSQRATLAIIKPEELTVEETDGIREALYALSGKVYRNVAVPEFAYLRHPRGIIVVDDSQKSFFIEALAGRGMVQRAREIFALIEIEARRRECEMIEGMVNDPRIMRLCARLGMKPVAEFYQRKIDPPADQAAAGQAAGQQK